MIINTPCSLHGASTFRSASNTLREEYQVSLALLDKDASHPIIMQTLGIRIHDINVTLLDCICT